MSEMPDEKDEQHENKTSGAICWCGSKVRSDDVKVPEMLLGYLIGPFGALLAFGYFYQHPHPFFTTCSS